MNLYKKIEEIRNARIKHLKSFDPTSLTEEQLVNACNDINLKSIRIHKYLTHNGLIGKVATARYLDSIKLNENSKLMDLNQLQIKSILEYVNQ
tara:strand:+ start:336 stop:614 length:279 start_codon:yes stop_codon:yes gene_type:complete